MFINCKREIYALAHLNMSTASFKCLSLTKVTVTTVRKLNGKNYKAQTQKAYTVTTIEILLQHQAVKCRPMY